MYFKQFSGRGEIKKQLLVTISRYIFSSLVFFCFHDYFPVKLEMNRARMM